MGFSELISLKEVSEKRRPPLCYTKEFDIVVCLVPDFILYDQLLKMLFV